MQISKNSASSQLSETCLADHRFKDDEIKKKKVEATHKQLACIGRLGQNFWKIEKLYLSYNRLKSLEGIESLPNLTSVSLVFNHLVDWEELTRIKHKSKLKFLGVHSNPLCRNPDYRRQLIRLFPNLEVLDDLKVNSMFKNYANDVCVSFSRKLIPFLALLESETQGGGEEESTFGNPNGLDTRRYDRLKFIEEFGMRLKSDGRMFIDVNAETTFYIERLTEFIRAIDSYTDYFDGVTFPSAAPLTNIYHRLFRDLTLLYLTENDHSLDTFIKQQLTAHLSFSEANDFINCFNNDTDWAMQEMSMFIHRMWPNQTCFCENYEIRFDIEIDDNENFCAGKLQDTLEYSDLGVKGQPYWRERVKHWQDRHMNEDPVMIHFPVFPLNNNFIRRLISVVKSIIRGTDYDGIEKSGLHEELMDGYKIKEKFKSKKIPATNGFSYMQSDQTLTPNLTKPLTLKRSSPSRLGQKSQKPSLNNSNFNMMRSNSRGNQRNPPIPKPPQKSKPTPTIRNKLESLAATIHLKLSNRRREAFLEILARRNIAVLFIGTEEVIYRHAHYDGKWRSGNLQAGFRSIARAYRAERLMGERERRELRRVFGALAVAGQKEAEKREVRAERFFERKMRFKCFIELIKFGAKRRMLVAKLFKKVTENRKFELHDCFKRFLFAVRNKTNQKRFSRAITPFDRSTEEQSLVAQSPFLVEDYSDIMKPKLPSEPRSLFIDKDEGLFNENPGRETAGFNKVNTMGDVQNLLYTDRLLQSFKVPDKALQTFGRGDFPWADPEKIPKKTVRKVNKPPTSKVNVKSKSKGRKSSLLSSKLNATESNASKLKEIIKNSQKSVNDINYSKNSRAKSKSKKSSKAKNSINRSKISHLDSSIGRNNSISVKSRDRSSSRNKNCEACSMYDLERP